MKFYFASRFLKITLLCVVLNTTIIASAQHIWLDSIYKSASYVETGAIYYHFRDELSSNLVYEGVGGGRIGGGYHLNAKRPKIHHSIDFSFEYGEAKYRGVPNEDYSAIYRLTGMYGLYKEGKSLTKYSTFSYGGTVTSDALYTIYPFLFGNNGNAYSIDLVSLGPSLNLDRSFNVSRLNFSINFDLLGWNIRPQNYSGISPERIWSETSIVTLVNALKFNFTASYIFKCGKQTTLELSYNWLYYQNSSTPNTLKWAQHNVNLRLYILKNRS